jgi:hypothetical protein
VTGFSQTPFTTRYHDAKRNEQAIMRAHISKACADEDSDCEDVDVQALLRMDVPDHLPGSPLCPLHVMHQSGGRSICPSHGTRKTMLNQALKRKSKVGGPRASLVWSKREPEIVFDSGDGSGSGSGRY